MKDEGAGIVMEDADRGWRLAATVVGPSDVAGQNVLGTLKAFEADYRSSRRRGGVYVMPRKEKFNYLAGEPKVVARIQLIEVFPELWQKRGRTKKRSKQRDKRAV
jgi:hypothetical protein